MQQTECTGANILDAGGVISGVADAQSITGDQAETAWRLLALTSSVTWIF